MEKSTFSIYFLVSPSKARKNGKTPINLIIRLNGQRASLSTHLFVSPKEWDSTRQRVKGTNESAKAINAVLKQILNRLYKKEAELLERGYVLTADLLRDAFLDKVDAIQSKTLVQTYLHCSAPDFSRFIDYITESSNNLLIIVRENLEAVSQAVLSLIDS